MRAQVVLHNLPTFSTYALGAIIMLFLGRVFFLAYILYCLFSTLWFMKFICAYCPHYGKEKCPSSYSKIAAKLFKKGNPAEFNTMFRTHIGIVFPSWIIPVIAAIYLLLYEFSILILFLLITFVVVGFVILPVMTKKYGCENCDLKENCPRMTGFKKRKK